MQSPPLDDVSDSLCKIIKKKDICYSIPLWEERTGDRPARTLVAKRMGKLEMKLPVAAA